MLSLHIVLRPSCPRACVSAMSPDALLLSRAVDVGDQSFEISHAEPSSWRTLSVPSHTKSHFLSRDELLSQCSEGGLLAMACTVIPGEWRRGRMAPLCPHSVSQRWVRARGTVGRVFQDTLALSSSGSTFLQQTSLCFPVSPDTCTSHSLVSTRQ